MASAAPSVQPMELLLLQRSAGNAAVGLLLQRQPPPPPAKGGTVAGSDDVQQALGEEYAILEDGIAEFEEDDPPEAAHLERTLLLAQFAAPATFADRTAVKEFIHHCDTDATKESVTLQKLGADARQLFLQYPQAFPQTWADELAKTLDIKADPASLNSEQQQAWQRLVAVADLVPALVGEYGLPLSLAEVGAVKKFELTPQHAQLSEADIIRDFAQTALAYRGTAMRAEIVRWWRHILSKLVENVRSGEVVIDPKDLAAMTGANTRILGFLGSGSAPGEDVFRQLDAEVVKLGELQMLTAIISVASGLKASGVLWREASGLLDTKLAQADAIIAGLGTFDTIKRTFLWQIGHDYVFDEFLLFIHALLSQWKEMAAKIAIIAGLQAVPGVNIVVDLWLIWEFGSDLVKALYGLAAAFTDAGSADTVLELQKASARLAGAVMGAPLRVLLDFFGLKATLKHLRVKALKIKDANPGMSMRTAARHAVRETPPTPTAKRPVPPDTTPTSPPQTSVPGAPAVPGEPTMLGKPPKTGEPVKTGGPEPTPKAVEPAPGGRAKPTSGKMRSGAQEGEAATADTVREGTVRMEEHPAYQSTIDGLRKEGVKIVEIVKAGEDPHLRVTRVTDTNGTILRTELELHVRPGMRYLDLEHEIGHFRQVTDPARFPNGPPPSDIVIERPGGTLAPSKQTTGILTKWQNTIVEYHNRLEEVIRLAERKVSPEVMREHLDGLSQARSDYFVKGLNKTRSRSQVSWAREHFPDIGQLEQRASHIREQLEATTTTSAESKPSPVTK